MNHPRNPCNQGEIEPEIWNTDQRCIDRSQPTPASTTIPSWHAFMKAARPNHPGASGSSRPGTTRSRMKKKPVATAMIRIGIISPPDCRYSTNPECYVPRLRRPATANHNGCDSFGKCHRPPGEPALEETLPSRS